MVIRPTQRGLASVWLLFFIVLVSLLIIVTFDNKKLTGTEALLLNALSSFIGVSYALFCIDACTIKVWWDDKALYYSTWARGEKTIPLAEITETRMTKAGLLHIVHDVLEIETTSGNTHRIVGYTLSLSQLRQVAAFLGGDLPEIVAEPGPRKIDREGLGMVITLYILLALGLAGIAFSSYNHHKPRIDSYLAAHFRAQSSGHYEGQQKSN